MDEESEPPSGRFNSITARLASLKRWEGVTEEQKSQFGAYLAHKRWNKLKKRLKRRYRNGGNGSDCCGSQYQGLKGHKMKGLD